MVLHVKSMVTANNDNPTMIWHVSARDASNHQSFWSWSRVGATRGLYCTKKAKCKSFSSAFKHLKEYLKVLAMWSHRTTSLYMKARVDRIQIICLLIIRYGWKQNRKQNIRFDLTNIYQILNLDWRATCASNSWVYPKSKPNIQRNVHFAHWSPI